MAMGVASEDILLVVITPEVTAIHGVSLYYRRRMALVVSAYSYAVPHGISLYYHRWVTQPVANAWSDAVPYSL